MEDEDKQPNVVASADALQVESTDDPNTRPHVQEPVHGVQKETELTTLGDMSAKETVTYDKTSHAFTEDEAR